VTSSTVGASPQTKARITGLLYLLVIVTAAFAEMGVRGPMIVSGDAAATARNIMAGEGLYRLGGVADLANLACDVAISILLYELLKPGGRTLARLAAAFRLMADACLAAATLFHFAPLFFLSGAPYLGAFTPAQLQALAYQALRVHGLGYNLCLVFFGIHLLLIGYLIARSAIIPRAIGALLALTGILYLVNSYVHLAAPSIHLPGYFLLPGFVSENAVAWWLLIFGVGGVKSLESGAPALAG
jgi:hypothetical protein